MRLGTYHGHRSSIFRDGQLVEIHMEAILMGAVKYLTKKHKLLNDYPFAKMERAENPIIYTSESFEYYDGNRDFVWVPEHDLNIFVDNKSSKHMLERFED